MVKAFSSVTGCYTLFLCLSLTSGFPKTPVGDPTNAIEGVVSRVLGQQYVNAFEYEVIPTDNGNDVLEVDVSSDKTKPVLRGNNGVSLASALNTYLKYLCNCSISWGRDGSGDQLNLPSSLPLPREKFRVVAPVKYR